MSQRAVPAMIAQPMFPLGDWKVSRWTTRAAGDDNEVTTVEDALTVVMSGPERDEVVELAVAVTTTVVVCLEPPHPSSTTDSNAVTPATHGFLTAHQPIRRGRRPARWTAGRAELTTCGGRVGSRT
jgi:hypothetical protein